MSAEDVKKVAKAKKGGIPKAGLLKRTITKVLKEAEQDPAEQRRQACKIFGLDSDDDEFGVDKESMDEEEKQNMTPEERKAFDERHEVRLAERER